MVFTYVLGVTFLRVLLICYSNLTFFSNFQYNNGNGARPTHLRFLSVNTMMNEACRRRLDNVLQQNIYEGAICAFSRRGQGICSGDAGNPLAYNGQLIGIASWKQRCARGTPDGFTRISTFASWIQQTSGVSPIA